MDDDEARRALRSLSDEPLPLVTTTVDEVLRRGRRRVLVQRVSAFAGVVAVVAAIAVGGVLLRPGDASGGAQVGSTNSSIPVFPSGWTQVVSMPQDIDPDADWCRQQEKEYHTPDVTLPSEEAVTSALLTSIEEVVGGTSTLTPQWGKRSGHMTVNLLMVDNRIPQIAFDGGTFGGTPRQAADGSVMAEGNCDAPWRRTLEDGTVLQLYPGVKEPAEAAPMLMIYRPDGVTFTFMSGGYGHVTTNPNGESVLNDFHFAASPEELATIGERFLAKLS
jgi:hypothetical protein